VLEGALDILHIRPYRGSMARILGINCTSAYTYLAVAEDGALLDGLPERLEPPSGEVSERLSGFLDAFERVLVEVQPSVVCLLLPEKDGRFKQGYTALEPRIAMETLVRLATVRSDKPEMRLVTRGAVRSALGLGRKGSLGDLVEDAISTPIGRYWGEGRSLAAMAALAGAAT